MTLSPVPLRVPVLDGAILSRHYAVYLNALAQAVNRLTPIGIYANNAAAVAANVPVGQVYQTATGELRVVV